MSWITHLIWAKNEQLLCYSEIEQIKRNEYFHRKLKRIASNCVRTLYSVSEIFWLHMTDIQIQMVLEQKVGEGK